MFRSIVLTGACVACGLALTVPSALRAQAGTRHPNLHYALYELRESRAELLAAAHNYGGHRAHALEATDAAIVQIELALRAVGDNTTGFAAGIEVYRRYKHHPHIHHALHALREARAELESARHNFGGHRAAAIRDINVAISQLEACLRHAR
jgi:hypothetical protein